MIPRRPRKRATYHHGDLRRALLDEALTLLREVGPDALSMRELARRLGVSLAAPHHHFAEKGELLAAIAEQAFMALAAQISAGLLHQHEPAAQLHTIASNYLAFAAAEPMRYRVMYLPQLADRKRFSALHATGGRALTLLAAVFQRGGVAPEKARARAVACWSTLHGFALLCIDDLLEETGEARRGLTLALITTACALP